MMPLLPFLAAVLTGGTCGVYSPDGSKIALQRDEGGQSRVGVWNRADGRFAWVETAPGNAAHPAWSPSGDALVYTFGNETNTAWAAKDGATGWHLRVWRRGEGVREITTGRVRDYMPSFSPDGTEILFVSTRDVPTQIMYATQSGVYAVGADGTGLRALAPGVANDNGAGQPVLSPDGKILAFAQICGFRDTWHLVCARADAPRRGCQVTPKGQSAYAPRWTPDGRFLVYTGFSAGDPGWCVYALDPRTGVTRRLCEGRNPDVHPSGKWLLYDDGETLHERPFGAEDWPIGAPTDEVRKEQAAVEAARIVWRAERPTCPATVPMDGRFAFGTERTFFVRARVRFRPAKAPRFRHFVTGAYEGAPLGFELFVDRDTPKFGAREASGLYMGVAAETRLENGKEYVLTGVRTHDALYIRVDDGEARSIRFTGTYPLDRPLNLSVGPTLDGTCDVLWAEVGTGWPEGMPRPATRQEVFGDAVGSDAINCVPPRMDAVSNTGVLDAMNCVPPRTPTGGTQFIASAPTVAGAFEKIAYIDSFDYPAFQETETAEGTHRILDNVLRTGATTILWRNQSGAVPRYPSAEEARPLKEPPLDKRRIPLSEPVRGWIRFDDCGTNLIRVAADECARRGVAFGIHLTTEENHGESWTLSPWNLEHPQYWCRSRGGAPWPGRCSLAWDAVREHKLRLFDELLALRPSKVFLDLCRAGGWTPGLEYVAPVEATWRRQYGTEPPTNWKDPRWTALVEAYTRRYYGDLRARCARAGQTAELIIAIERAGDARDFDYEQRAVDWRRLLREGVVDAVSVACVTPDWNDPWGSTARLYADIVREVRAIGRGRVYFPIMAYNFNGRPGFPEYAQRAGLSEAAAVRRLLELAHDAGGDGITMEVVDAHNYSDAVCAEIRNFHPKTHATHERKERTDETGKFRRF